MRTPLLLFLILYSFMAFSQAGAGMKYGKRMQEYSDSLKNVDYHYFFPILGKKVYKKGIDVPFPVGVMLNGMTAGQDIIIDNLQVGFSPVNNGEKVPLDFVKFGNVRANLQTINTRVDVWVLPFLNVYGIAGKTWTGIEVPITSPINFTTKSNFSGSTYGVGGTASGGFHGYFVTLDFNSTWTSMEQLDKPVNAIMVTPRIGACYPFNHKPQSNIAVWIGASHINYNRTTSGEVSLADIGVNLSREKLDAIANGAEDWYNNLTPAQQAVVKKIAEKLRDKADGANVKDFKISYSLDKKPTHNWCAVAGMQYQYTKHWQARTEFMFFGGRLSGLLSLNYRFLL